MTAEIPEYDPANPLERAAAEFQPPFEIWWLKPGTARPELTAAAATSDYVVPILRAFAKHPDPGRVLVRRRDGVVIPAAQFLATPAN